VPKNLRVILNEKAIICPLWVTNVKKEDLAMKPD
jgi:hypothetical protein